LDKVNSLTIPAGSISTIRATGRKRFFVSAAIPFKERLNRAVLQTGSPPRVNWNLMKREIARNWLCSLKGKLPILDAHRFTRSSTDRQPISGNKSRAANCEHAVCESLFRGCVSSTVCFVESVSLRCDWLNFDWVHLVRLNFRDLSFDYLRFRT